MIKVLVAGTFDIIHPGHLFLLKEAKKKGDYLTVIIARDFSVKKIKGKLPHNKQNVRIKNLKKTKIANQIILGNTGDKLVIVAKIRPDIICLGYDQQITISSLGKGLKKLNLAPKIIRLSALKPNKYKSSIYRQSLK